jgi:hypothetical protein
MLTAQVSAAQHAHCITTIKDTSRVTQELAADAAVRISALEVRSLLVYAALSY